VSGLLRFAVRRVLAMIVVLWAIVTVVFFLAHASPYDPIRLILGQKYNSVNAGRLRVLFGLDKPLWQQYLDYLGNLAHGNLGYSEEAGTLGQPVWSLLQAGIPVTLKLGAYALLLSLLIGLPVGLLSALRQNTFVDHASQTVMMLFYAVPTFVLVPVSQVVFGAQLKWLPVSGWGDPGALGEKELVLPVTLYAAGLTGYFAKSFRSFMLEVLQQDYIRTARAKGLLPRIIIYRHAVRNAMLPLASIVGPVVAFLIVGAFIIEYFFSIPGIAYITVTSVTQSDYPVIEATTVLLAGFVVVVNMLTDILYAVIDPRIEL
jgi:peptide/nickel transport system permease protein/oligopeptide transport system permease protein